MIPTEPVIVMHGFAAPASSTALLVRRLTNLGHHVEAWSYPSLTTPVRELAKMLRSFVDSSFPCSKRVHFVCHSMGSLVFRAAFEQFDPSVLGRAVFLAPPLGGAPLTRFVPRSVRRHFPPLDDLQTGPDGLTASLPLPPFDDLAVIAGRFDVLVPLGFTRTPGLQYHRTLNQTHNSLLASSTAARLTDSFLRKGTLDGGRP